MMYLKQGAIGVLVVSLAACASPKPEPITPVLILNKYGEPSGGGCEDDPRYIPGSRRYDECDPPDDTCYDPGAPVGSSVEIPCPRPRFERDENEDPPRGTRGQPNPGNQSLG